MIRDRAVVCAIACCLGLAFTAVAHGATKAPCVGEEQMLEIIAKIPKSFPYSEKSSSFRVVGSSESGLHASVKGLRVTYFDYRDDDKSKWFTIANKGNKDGLQEDMGEVGCVRAGMNMYESGDIDRSKNALEKAQQKYNEMVQITIKAIK